METAIYHLKNNHLQKNSSIYRILFKQKDRFSQALYIVKNQVTHQLIHISKTVDNSVDECVET